MVEDKKLKLKLKFSLKKREESDQQQQQQQQQQEIVVDEVAEEQQVAAEDDELEEGEIREDEEDQVQQPQINNNNNVDDNNNNNNNVDNNNDATCPLCGKVFGSGKALGGHLRIHPEYNPKSNKKPIVSGPNPAQKPDPSAQKALGFPCDHCWRSFSTKKSLYGHMRSHPEREYRGMKPPTDETDPSPSNSNPEPDVRPDVRPETVSSSSGWSRLDEIKWKQRGKRGRVKKEETSSSASTIDHQVEVAAADLMLLSAGGGGGNGGRGERKLIRKDGKTDHHDDMDDMDEKMKLENYDEDELYFLQDYLGISVPSTSSSSPSDIPIVKNDPIIPEKKSLLALKMKIKEKKKKMVSVNDNDRKSKKRKLIRDSKSVKAADDHRRKTSDDGDDGDDDGGKQKVELMVNKWECTTCNKTFPTHQALGGHKSSHNKLKSAHLQTPKPNTTQTLILTLTRTSSESEDGGGSGGSVSGSVNGSSDDLKTEVLLAHKCKICHKDCASAQDLGWHYQECHNVPSTKSSPNQVQSDPITEQIPSTESTPDQVQSFPQTGRRSVLDLDLNLPALEEDGDGVVTPPL